MISVNIKMTRKMVRSLDRGNKNRSHLTRQIIAALIHADQRGRPEPLQAAMELGRQSTISAIGVQRYRTIKWINVTVRIPAEMQMEIQPYLSGTELHVADFVRGAVIGYSGETIFDEPGAA